jgi:hypothetical protein
MAVTLEGPNQYGQLVERRLAKDVNIFYFEKSNSVSGKPLVSLFSKDASEFYLA